MDKVAFFEQEQATLLLEKKQEVNRKNKDKEFSMPEMRIGDTVLISYRIQEGDKFRNQPFQGTLIKRSGSGISKTFTLRKIVAGEGVERIFPLHSPNLVSIEVVRYGKARRAKLYYLRDRVGKATKIKERTVIQPEVEQTEKKKRKRKSKAEKELVASAKIERKKERLLKKKSKKDKGKVKTKVKAKKKDKK